jgi:hypothetical protein
VHDGTSHEYDDRRQYDRQPESGERNHAKPPDKVNNRASSGGYPCAGQRSSV